jgi:hypothetical protein
MEGFLSGLGSPSGSLQFASFKNELAESEFVVS